MKIQTDTIDVEIIGIGQVTGKVDTGAHQSSLHAEHIQIDGDVVRFQYDGRFFQSNIETEQQISSSDGGTTTRPVITADIKINNQTITTLLNLNDRSEMPEPMLIGQDIIRAVGLSIELPNEEPDVDGNSVDVQTSNSPLDAGDQPDSNGVDPTEHVEPESNLSVDEISFDALKRLAKQINLAIEALEKQYGQKSI